MFLTAVVTSIRKNASGTFSDCDQLTAGGDAMGKKGTKTVASASEKYRITGGRGSEESCSTVSGPRGETTRTARPGGSLGSLRTSRSTEIDQRWLPGEYRAAY